MLRRVVTTRQAQQRATTDTWRLALLLQFPPYSMYVLKTWINQVGLSKQGYDLRYYTLHVEAWYSFSLMNITNQSRYCHSSQATAWGGLEASLYGKRDASL